MRRISLTFVIIYSLLFGASLLYSFCHGLRVTESFPALFLTEPWTSLEDLIDPHGDYSVDYTWEFISYTGAGILIAGGIVNAAILWGVSRLFKKPN
jgi:hypothetical protein